MTNWKPIDDYAKSGAAVWALLNYHDEGGPEQHAMRWNERWESDEFPWAWAWCSNRNTERAREDVVTRYMPLPDPPEEER